MSGKFMQIRRIILPIMVAVVLISQLSGCAAVSSNEMMAMISEGSSIELVINEPKSYNASEIKGEQKVDVDWEQLDQATTFSQGFRQDFDKLFDIITINENNKGGKNGCMFITALDGKEYRDGNTTLEDSMRNKVFIEKYWNTQAVQDTLASLATEAYTDVSKDDAGSVYAALNAYYNLLNDAENPTAFNGNQLVSREQFMTMMYKAENGVSDLEYTPTSDTFAQAVGGDTAYTMYAKQQEKNSYLKTQNGSLTKDNIGRAISRGEAVYSVVQAYFPDLIAQQDGKAATYSDAKSAGDISSTLMFEKAEQKQNNLPKDTVSSKQHWELYTLNIMLKNPDKGLDVQLYKTLQVAHTLELLGTSGESRWDEAITKEEALELMVNVYTALNEQPGGYLTLGARGEQELPTAGGNSEWVANGGEGSSTPVEYPVLYEDADGNIKWATGDGTPHDNSVLEKKLKEQEAEMKTENEATPPEAEKPPVEAEKPVEKEKPPVEKEKPAGWDTPVIPDGLTGGTTDNTTNDGSLVDPNAENPFN